MTYQVATVVNALLNNGYDLRDMIHSAKFVKLTASGSANIYEITYDGEDGRETGLVYVWMSAHGKLLADF